MEGRQAGGVEVDGADTKMESRSRAGLECGITQVLVCVRQHSETELHVPQPFCF